MKVFFYKLYSLSLFSGNGSLIPPFWIPRDTSLVAGYLSTPSKMKPDRTPNTVDEVLSFKGPILKNLGLQPIKYSISSISETTPQLQRLQSNRPSSAPVTRSASVLDMSMYSSPGSINRDDSVATPRNKNEIAR